MNLKKPPMGWNSYDYYDTTVNEEQVRENADYMAAHLKEYGWEYVVVDIAWYSYEAGEQRERFQYVPFCHVEMDEYSRLLPCVKRFPSSADGKGFGPLADYVHGLGLKFGIHIMRGIPRQAAYQRTKILGIDKTANEIADAYSICGWNPDMYGVTPGVEGAQEYYDSIVSLYADWGVDFIKCDDICRMDESTLEYGGNEIEMIHRAIEKCGRDIVLSLSPGPALVEENEFYHENANMWRITDDLWDNWESLRDMFDRCHNWQGLTREGGYPDCDMLPLGWLGKGFGHEWYTNFTPEEQHTMLTLWCLFGSPLMLGCELTKLDDATLALLTNRDVLSMLTPDCKPHQVCLDDEKAIWCAHNAVTGEHFAAFFNLSDETQTIHCDIETLHVGDEPCAHKDASLTELWSKEKTSVSGSAISVTPPAHGCLVFRVEN